MDLALLARVLWRHKIIVGLGFTAVVLPGPDQAIHAQDAVDRVVAELRSLYELIDG